MTEPTTAAGRFRARFRRLRLLHRLGRGRMTVEEFEAEQRDDGMCAIYGHVATGKDFWTCTVCGKPMP